MEFVRVKGCMCPSLEAHFAIFPRLISDMGAVTIRLTGAQLPSPYCLTSLLPMFDAKMAEQLFNEAGPVEITFSYLNIGTYQSPFVPVDQTSLDHIVYYQDRAQLDNLYFTNRSMMAYALNTNGRRINGREYIAFPVSNSLFRWVTADSFGRLEHDQNCYECAGNTIATSIRCIVPLIPNWQQLAPARTLAELDPSERRTFVPSAMPLTFGTSGCMLKRTDMVVNCYSQDQLGNHARAVISFGPATSLNVTVPYVASTVQSDAPASGATAEEVASLPTENKPSSSLLSSSSSAAPGVEPVSSEGNVSVTSESIVGVILQDMSVDLPSIASDVVSPMDIEVSTAVAAPGAVSTPVSSVALAPTSAQPSVEVTDEGTKASTTTAVDMIEGGSTSAGLSQETSAAGTSVAKRIYRAPPPDSLYARWTSYKAECKKANVIPLTEEANLVVPNPFPEYSRPAAPRSDSPPGYPDYLSDDSSSCSDKSFKNIPKDYRHRKVLMLPLFKSLGAQGPVGDDYTAVGGSGSGSPSSGGSITIEKRQASSPGCVPSSKRISTCAPAATDPQLCQIWSEVSVGFDLPDLYRGDSDDLAIASAAAASPSVGEHMSATPPPPACSSAPLPGTPESCFTTYSSSDSSQVYSFPTSSSSPPNSDRIRLTDEQHMRMVWGMELEYREGHQPVLPPQVRQQRAPQVTGQEDSSSSDWQEDYMAWMALGRRGSTSLSSLERSSHSTLYSTCDSESESSFGVSLQARADPTPAGVLSTVAQYVPSFLRNVFGRVLGLNIRPAAQAPAGDGGRGEGGQDE